MAWATCSPRVPGFLERARLSDERVIAVVVGGERVRGSSMEPSLRDGDRVLALRHLPVRRDRVIVVRLVNGRYVVKRVHAVVGDEVPVGDYPTLRATPTVPDGCLILRGDNAGHSFDSRHAGYFSTADVRGVAVRLVSRAPVPPRRPAGSNDGRSKG